MPYFTGEMERWEFARSGVSRSEVEEWEEKRRLRVAAANGWSEKRTERSSLGLEESERTERAAESAPGRTGGTLARHQAPAHGAGTERSSPGPEASERREREDRERGRRVEGWSNPEHRWRGPLAGEGRRDREESTPPSWPAAPTGGGRREDRRGGDPPKSIYVIPSLLRTRGRGRSRAGEPPP